MRLKLRYIRRQSQEEIDRSFNPINLDYIFDEDDPLNLWLEEREHAVLDDEDNSYWLNLIDDDNANDGGDDDDDDNGGGGRGRGTDIGELQTTIQSSSSSPDPVSDSDDNEGLSPSDEDGGDGGGTAYGGDGDGDGDDYSDVGGTAYGGDGDDNQFIGSHGLSDVRDDYYVGEPVAPLPQLSGVEGRERRRNGMQQFDVSDEGSSSQIEFSLGDLRLDQGYDYSYLSQQNHQIEEYSSSYSDMQQRQLSDTFPSRHYPPPLHQIDRDNMAMFTYIFPTRWDEGSSSNTQDQSESQEAPEPPCHSFWW